MTVTVTLRSTPRFQVVEGSSSGHCCFDATVIDGNRLNAAGGLYRTCECFDIEDAKMIAGLLNKQAEAESRA